MSHPTSHQTPLKPRPLQPLMPANNSSSKDSSRAPSPQPGSAMDGQTDPSSISRTRSLLNLTSSTLFGIYSPTDYGPDREGDSNTPWGTGAETPYQDPSRKNSTVTDSQLDHLDDAWRRNKRRRSSVMQASRVSMSGRKHSMHKKRKSFRNYCLPLASKMIALGGLGVCYGILISHLHDREQIVPVKVEGIAHNSQWYKAFWGVVAIALGQLMPFVDDVWAKHGRDEDENAIVDEEPTFANGDRQANGVAGSAIRRQGGQTEARWAPEWNDVVRSIGAFIGIAFAIRKLPWQSTLQLSLTLALSNPAIWYLLDRTVPGFLLSTIVSLSGTGVLLSLNPDLIPAPQHSAPAHGHGYTGNATLFQVRLPEEGDLVAGLLRQESVGVATWIASVLFVSCICFGNIGRRL